MSPSGLGTYLVAGGDIEGAPHHQGLPSSLNREPRVSAATTDVCIKGESLPLRSGLGALYLPPYRRPEHPIG